jgi:hypothetical protein
MGATAGHDTFLHTVGRKEQAEPHVTNRFRDALASWVLGRYPTSHLTVKPSPNRHPNPVGDASAPVPAPSTCPFAGTPTAGHPTGTQLLSLSHLQAQHVATTSLPSSSLVTSSTWSQGTPPRARPCTWLVATARYPSLHETVNVPP